MSDKKPPPRWRSWLLEGLLFAAIFIGIQLWQARDTPRGAAPAFSGQRLDGSLFQLADWRREHPGEAVLIYFWADWCPVCRTTAGNVSAIADEWPLLSIASQSGDAAQIGKVMAERGYAWPTLPDPTGALMQQYGLPGVPACIVLDPAGNIRFVTLGYTSELGLRLRLWWAGLENT